MFAGVETHTGAPRSVGQKCLISHCPASRRIAQVSPFTVEFKRRKKSTVSYRAGKICKELPLCPGQLRATVGVINADERIMRFLSRDKSALARFMRFALMRVQYKSTRMTRRFFFKIVDPCRLDEK